MGIRSLLRFLEVQDALPSPHTEIPPGSTLMVDASSFLFYIFTKHLTFQDKVLGGDYARMDEYITQEVEHLENDLGLELIVFFDGPKASSFKLETSDLRNARREEEWSNWNAYCNFPTKKTHAIALPQIPSLAWCQFSHTLGKLGVRMVESEGEADAEIALQIQQYNILAAGRKQYFCYARDSDFAAMRACPYIAMGTLQKSAERGVVTAPVFVRHELAQRLQVTEQAFVELCLLLGNDYLPETTTSFIFPPNTPRGGWEAAERNLALFQSNPNLVLVSKEHEDALAYSRRFYNLTTRQDVAALCEEDASKTKEDRFLTAEECAWLKTIETEYTDASHLLRDVHLKQQATKAAFFPALGLSHLYALAQMLSPRTARMDPSLAAAAAATPPVWQDIVAGQIWQAIVRILYRKGLIKLEPSALFDGQRLHYFLYQIHQDELSRAALASPYAKADQVSTPAAAKKSPAAAAPRSASSSSARKKTSVAPLVRDTLHDVLPIDAKREEILRAVQENHVTLICGETGCGKSTKVCQFLAQYHHQRGVKMLISQPTRIAVLALMNRLRKTLGRRVGMRMGNNTVDEFPETDIWFVTTGYLVRRLSSLENKNEFTHIIVDEMHERSIQADLAVLLAKKLVTEDCSTTKLVLMSATANINLYESYFANEALSVANLFVGAKRFENEILYVDELEELCPDHLTRGLARTLSVGSNLGKDQCKIVLHLLRISGRIPLGSGVLVFVSGLAGIESMFELLEPFSSKIKLFAIHSQLSDEYDPALFEPCARDEIKVIVATNAAQSSITIPDVDFVIDFGTHKAMKYNQRTHTSVLEEQWISQSSAVQRAGRTGRVQPGTVFRLYARKVFETEFSQHDTAEILECPLDDTILNLRSTFEHQTSFSGVVPLLNEMLEAPDLDCIQNSFVSLHRMQMITEPNDFGLLTTCGRFVSRLSIGTNLGRLVALGICLGVGWEICVIASALSQPKPVFRMTHQLLHAPEENYEILRGVLLSTLQLDCGYESEPIMMLQIYKLFKRQGSGETWDVLARAFNMSQDRLRAFMRSTDHLLRQVGLLLLPPGRGRAAAAAAVDEDFASQTPEFAIESDKLTRIRLLLTWTSAGRVLQLNASSSNGGSARKNGGDFAGSSPVVVMLPTTAAAQQQDALPSANLVQSWFPRDTEWEYTLPKRIITGKLQRIVVGGEELCLELRTKLQVSSAVLTEQGMVFSPLRGSREIADLFGEDFDGFLPLPPGYGEDEDVPIYISAAHCNLAEMLFVLEHGNTTSGTRQHRACALAQITNGWLVEIELFNVPKRAEVEAELLASLFQPKTCVTRTLDVCTLRFPADSIASRLFKTYLHRSELRMSEPGGGKDVIKLPVKLAKGRYPFWKPVRIRLEQSIFKLLDNDGEEEEEYWEVASDNQEELDDGGLIQMSNMLIIGKPSVAHSFVHPAGFTTVFAIVSRSMETAGATVAEHVSLIPNAKQFLPLAFACVGWQAKGFGFSRASRADEECSLIREVLGEVLQNEKTITHQPALCDLVDQVFPGEDCGPIADKCEALLREVARISAQRRSTPTPKKQAVTPKGNNSSNNKMVAGGLRPLATSPVLLTSDFAAQTPKQQQPTPKSAAKQQQATPLPPPKQQAPTPPMPPKSAAKQQASTPPMPPKSAAKQQAPTPPKSAAKTPTPLLQPKQQTPVPPKQRTPVPPKQRTPVPPKQHTPVPPKSATGKQQAPTPPPKPQTPAPPNSAAKQTTTPKQQQTPTPPMPPKSTTKQQAVTLPSFPPPTPVGSAAKRRAQKERAKARAAAQAAMLNSPVQPATTTGTPKQVNKTTTPKQKTPASAAAPPLKTAAIPSHQSRPLHSTPAQYQPSHSMLLQHPPSSYSAPPVQYPPSSSYSAPVQYQHPPSYSAPVQYQPPSSYFVPAQQHLPPSYSAPVQYQHPPSYSAPVQYQPPSSYFVPAQQHPPPLSSAPAQQHPPSSYIEARVGIISHSSQMDEKQQPKQPKQECVIF